MTSYLACNKTSLFLGFGVFAFVVGAGLCLSSSVSLDFDAVIYSECRQLIVIPSFKMLNKAGASGDFS